MIVRGTRVELERAVDSIPIRLRTPAINSFARDLWDYFNPPFATILEIDINNDHAYALIQSMLIANRLSTP